MSTSGKTGQLVITVSESDKDLDKLLNKGWRWAQTIIHDGELCYTLIIDDYPYNDEEDPDADLEERNL